MTDSRARLHCCGAHHGDHHVPAGLSLTLATSPPITCYGTGENQDSAVLLISRDSEFSVVDNVHVKLLADQVSRGADVTVLVPHFTYPTIQAATTAESHKLNDEAQIYDDSKKRKLGEINREAEPHSSVLDFTQDNLARLVRHLKHIMSVQFIGILFIDPSDMDLGTFDTMPELNCTVTFIHSKQLTTAEVIRRTARVPMSLVVLSSDGDEEVNVIEEPVLTRITAISETHARFILDMEHAQYKQTMREILYCFKKHLHDWS